MKTLSSEQLYGRAILYEIDCLEQLASYASISVIYNSALQRLWIAAR